MINLSAVSVQMVRNDDLLNAVKTTCEFHHYLHRYPDPRSLPFAYVLEIDGSPFIPGEIWRTPWGIVVFKKPQHHRQRNLFGYEGLPTAWQVLDLASSIVNTKDNRQMKGAMIAPF